MYSWQRVATALKKQSEAKTKLLHLALGLISRSFEEPSADYAIPQISFTKNTNQTILKRICVIGVICGYYFCGRFAQP
jgi:hypothetical protein